MNCVVTGAAGFIGSHLCERLLDLGHSVAGLDAFTSYYARTVKEGNLSAARNHPRFRFFELDLRHDPLEEALANADLVFHLAATPGLVQSWTNFDGYLTTNVVATQRLLEALRSSSARPRRLIYASTSSVYGLFASGDEGVPTRPASPYGITKLAAEQLCRAYADACNLAVVTLRYFSVYGPRQRPDMAYHRFMQALLGGQPITVFGDGHQVRGNTYVADCVEATVAAIEAPPGEIYNVGGGESASVWDILRRLEALAGCQAIVRQEEARAGDQRQTFADTTRIRRHLGWVPRTTLEEGLAQQWHWHRTEQGRLAPTAPSSDLLTANRLSR
jgi:nucleoside-diphosphate-sugar epimerase